MHPYDGRVVSNFIMQALLDQPITLYGDGSQTRAFCYVDDLIEGMMRLMNADDEVTGPVNLGNPNEVSIRALAERIREITGSSSELEDGPLPEDDPVRRCPDITLARARLGWEPTVDLDAGLRATITYFRTIAGASGASAGPPSAR